ncbi:MAG: hypothetical protein ACE5I7_04605 [Candidatus Binatia bacterium]
MAERNIAVAPELRYTIGGLALLGLTLVIPGGRVLVLPAILVLILVLLFWAAKPKRKE